MEQRTALYQQHCQADAKLVPFGGWEMPLHYGSQIEEHHAVRQHAGVFDVSHMTIVDVHGEQSQNFLRYLLANDVAKLKTSGKALYSCMLNPRGGVIDDLIVYLLHDTAYRLVVNASTRDKDLAWITQQAAAFQILIKERDDLSMLAIQGPQAIQLTIPLLPATQQAAAQALKPFHAIWQADDSNWNHFVARTGYTGEDGFEVMLPNADAPAFWQALLDAEVKPTGLGARDTLRIEAGMNLYGTDMDETITPLEAGLSWTVAMRGERDFIGRDALQSQQDVGVFMGLVLQDKGVLRGHQTVHVPDLGDGEVTSGTFSPTMQQSIGMARLPNGTTTGQQVTVKIRNRELSAIVVNMPFVRQGKVLIGG